MLRCVLWIPACLAFVILLVLPAGAAELQDVVAAVEAPFRAETAAHRRINDYRADFVQESHIVSLNRLQQVAGMVVVRFEATGSAEPKVLFRWEYQPPAQQQIVSDGETVWVYLPENNQVIKTEAAKLLQPGESNPTTFLTGLGNLARDFEISWAEPQRNAAGDYRLELVPRQTSPLISKLFLVIDQAAVEAFLQPKAGPAAAPLFPVLSATVADMNNNRSILTFANVVVNIDPSPASFRFVIPEGVDVVDSLDTPAGF